MGDRMSSAMMSGALERRRRTGGGGGGTVSSAGLVIPDRITRFRGRAITPRLLLAAGLVLPAGWRARPAAAPPPFTVGETLEYDARIGLVPAGSATTSVVRMAAVRGQPVYVFSMHGAGGPPGLRSSYAMTSWTGVEPFVSRRFDRSVTLAGRTEQHEYEIVPDSLRYRETGAGAEPRDWVAPATPLDELAFLYYLRTLPLAPGDARVLRGYFRNGYNPVTVTVTGRENVTLGNGRAVACLALRITAAGTVSRVWLTDDPRRLPAQLELPLTIGRARLVLRGS